MRIGYAMDLHASASESQEVSWERLRDQALLAERVDFDIVVVPDHLLYAAGGEGDYAREDVAVGAWESVTIAAALAATTSRIDIGHSMFNLPYRPPALVAYTAATLDAVSGGRYHLGIGSGNSFDYEALGVRSDHRHDRFREGVKVVHDVLKQGRADVHGQHVSARGAERVLSGPRQEGPPLVIAAEGPRSMGVAARYGDAWNCFAPTDPEHLHLQSRLQAMTRACDEEGRDPVTLGRTVDMVVDPLDRDGGWSRSREALLALVPLGVDEVRCYLSTDDTHASRMAAVTAMERVIREVQDAG